MHRKYLTRTEFDSYEDFKENYQVNIPANFNFAFDVVDEIAAKTPDKIALVWCDDQDDSATFTFADLKRFSDKTANFFKSLGIQKGDPVMLILKRRYEFWFCLLALHKIGAVCIPATHLVTAKDIEYRNRSAAVKMIVCVAEQDLVSYVEESQKNSPSLEAEGLGRGQASRMVRFP